MILFSNCKINLGLRVVAKRNDGYHNLETLMFPVQGLCDAIELIHSSQEGPHFTSSGLVIDCPDEENLCLKAYHILKKDFPLGGVRIHLHKRIPLGAGLGGGSANAAYLIRGLNELFALELTLDQQEHYAAQIGSDTAFFIRNQSALATGRGELLTPCPVALNGYRLVIIKPNIHVSTADAYRGVRPVQPSEPLTEILKRPVTAWKEGLINDFEATVFAHHPQIAAIKAELYEMGALYASMSGSGASVYGIFAPDTPPLTPDTQHFIYQENIG